MKLQGILFLALRLSLAIVLSACGRNEPGPTPSQPGPSSPATPSTQATPAPLPNPVNDWAGRWVGPEGTYLNLEPRPDSRFEVIIRNLDGERSFQGVAGDGQVSFERDGQQEVIKATDGAGTGMKWLAGKTHCLVIRLGEGYCRD